MNEFEVPSIIVGAWQLSAGHNIETSSTDEAIDTFSKCADAGLTSFDCADIYTGVEELLGEFLRRYSRHGDSENRKRIRIHTKFVPDRDVLPRISKDYVERIIDRSLARLGVGQLDLVQFAWWDYTVPGYVETALWQQELQSEGKIRNIGVTNFDVPRLREIVGAGVPIVSHQVQYSLLDHRPENAMAGFCRDNGIQMLCYGTLAGGFLTDRWLGVPEPREELANRSLVKYKLMIDEFGGWSDYQELLRLLGESARAHDVSIGNVATRYALEMPQVSAAIVGTRSTEHLNDNLRVLSLQIDRQDIDRLRKFAVPRSARGDVYELERVPESRHAAIMRYNLNQGSAE